MSTKYICMKEGCDFAGESESEAREHMANHSGHHVVEVVSTNGGVDCSMLNDTGEEIADEELPDEADEEMMTEEEEKE